LLKKIAQFILILVFASSMFLIINNNTSYAAPTDPANLKIFVGPTSVLADNNTYNCIFVQLQDSTGKPARALQDTTISLSSSLTNIGTVNPSIIVPKGATYASASFSSTFSPGTTAISASATGYANVQASIVTIGPIPNAVAIYGFPSTLPADGNTYNAIMVQLQDLIGSPAKAPKGGVLVTLSCSDGKVGNVTQNVIIPEGKTFATASFTTRQNSTNFQSVIITTVAQGYTSQQLTITTTPVASNPSLVKIFVGPSQVPADDNSCPQIAIELQNVNGWTSTIPSDTIVSIASSDPTIGQIDSQITIPANQTYALATLNTTYKPGTITITAVATNLSRGQQSMTTTGFVPSKLAVYCSPPLLASDKGTYQSVQVQLQDSLGRPAKDPQADVNVNLFSSQPSVGTVGSTLTIPFGQTQASGTITVTNTAGATTITAQASSYTTGQGTVTTYTIDFLPIQVSATASPSTIINGQKTNVIVYITADSTAVTGAAVQFTSDNGGTFTSTTDLGNGSYNTNFTAPSFTKETTCTITASASKIGYVTSQTTTQITVQPPSTATSSPSPTSTTSSNETLADNSTATIQLRIEDFNNNPLSDANVSSTTQPTGTGILSDLTNSSGYVIFTNVTVGQYSFSIEKDGYEQMNKAINFTGLPVNMTLSLSIKSVPSANNNSLLLPIIVVVIVIVIVILMVVLLLRRRHSSSDQLPDQPSFKLSQFQAS
jgi:hypothetical protein